MFEILLSSASLFTFCIIFFVLEQFAVQISRKSVEQPHIRFKPAVIHGTCVNWLQRMQICKTDRNGRHY
jgi:hypothetical protein